MKMKTTVTVMMFVIAAIALTSVTVGATIGFTTSAFAGGGGGGGGEQQEKFIAELTGVEEVLRTVDTSAIGVAEFKLGQDNNIMYTLNVTDIENVTAAHVHSGQVGENGPVVVTLFKEDTPTAAATIGVLLSEGNITATNLEGLMAGKPLSNLISAMRNEQTYVNVHTQQNPDGEIRGQILDEITEVTVEQ
jgi:hypothetical protein